MSSRLVGCKTWFHLHHILISDDYLGYCVKAREQNLNVCRCIEEKAIRGGFYQWESCSPSQKVSFCTQISKIVFSLTQSGTEVNVWQSAIYLYVFNIFKIWSPPLSWPSFIFYRHGIQTPVNQAMVFFVKALEAKFLGGRQNWEIFDWAEQNDCFNFCLDKCSNADSHSFLYCTNARSSTQCRPSTHSHLCKIQDIRIFKAL